MRKVFMFLFVLIFAFADVRIWNQNQKGYDTVLSICSEESEQWIEQNFEDDNFTNLLAKVYGFSLAEFCYDNSVNELFQTFSIEDFIKDDFHGVCFDISNFAKTIINHQAKHHPEWGKIKSYVICVRYANGTPPHAYNYFQTENYGNFVCDLTSDCYYFNHGEKDLMKFLPIDETIEDFAKRNGQRIFLKY